MTAQEHERERYKTHSYWYKPSGPRVDYSLLIMVAAGMMKMATGDDFPLRRSAGTGSRLIFRGYRGFRRRTSDLGLPRGFLEYLAIYRAKRRCGRPQRSAQPTWARLGPQARPGGLCSPRSPPLVLLWPNRCLLVQKKSPKSFVAFGLRLVLIFCEVKNKQKP